MARPRTALAVARPFLALAAVFALTLPLAAGPLAPPAHAVAQWGTPSAKSTFGREIVFTQPLVVDRTVERVEILVETPGSLGPFVTPVELTAPSGSQTLSHRVELSDGHITPNTPFTARWRVTYADGTTEVGPEASVTYADTRFDWRTRGDDVVRVHWYEGGDDFGNRALAIGQAAIRETAELLGVEETEPVDFFVYADQEPFYDALGPSSRENVGGRAIAETRTMFALIEPSAIDDSWVRIVIPHELVHLVFDTAVDNAYHYPAHWLNEGLATYLTEGHTSQDRALVEAAAADGSLIPLDGLEGQFPTSRERFFLAYAESASAVDFLVRRWGDDALVDLVRSYAGGVSDDEAFEAATGLDTEGFDRAWRDELGAVDPVAYGPRPAPPGPLPPGWDVEPGSSPEPGAPSNRPSASSPPGGAPVDEASGPGIAPVLAIAALAIGVVGVGLILADRRRRV